MVNDIPLFFFIFPRNILDLVRPYTLAEASRERVSRPQHHVGGKGITEKGHTAVLLPIRPRAVDHSAIRWSYNRRGAGTIYTGQLHPRDPYNQTKTFWLFYIE